MALDRKIDINNTKMQVEGSPKKEDRKKKIEVELVFEPSEENELLSFQALNILIPKEDIRNYLLKKNHNGQNLKLITKKL